MTDHLNFNFEDHVHEKFKARVANLPDWVDAGIAGLERTIAELRHEISRCSKRVKKDPVLYAEDFKHASIPVQGDMIVYEQDGAKWRVTFRGGEIRISNDGISGHVVPIQEASNTIRVMVLPYKTIEGKRR